MARTKKGTALTPEERLQAALVPDWEWPHKLPGNWCWTNWGECGEFVAGSGFKNEYQGFTNYDIPFYKVSSLKTANGTGYLCDNTNTVDETVRKKLKAALIPANSLLFAKIGEAIRLNRRAINTVPCCVDNNMMAFIPIICQLKYAFYWSKGIDLYDFTNATTVPAIRKTDLEKISFPLAPLAEQQRIVDRIESLFAKLDEAKEKAQAVVDSFEPRKAAILHKAFTGELTAKWREEHGSSIGHWKECSIGDVFTHTTGKALKRNNQNGILKKYITTSNLYWGTFDFSEVREMYFTNEELEKCTAKKGDLLVCNGGDVGRAAIWNYDYDICLQNHISKLRRKTDSISVPFFYYYFMFLKINGNIAGRGIGIASLSAKYLLAIKVYLPPMTEQQQISHILDELFDKEQQTKEAAEAVLDRIELMKKSILARAFRGELGTNDPSEESAVELLKRTIL